MAIIDAAIAQIRHARLADEAGVLPADGLSGITHETSESYVEDSPAGSYMANLQLGPTTLEMFAAKGLKESDYYLRVLEDLDESLRRHIVGECPEGHMHRYWALYVYLRPRSRAAHVGPHDLVAVFEWSIDGDHGIADELDVSDLDEPPFTGGVVAGNCRYTGDRQSVLVFIGERVENGKAVFMRLVAARVRLDTGS